MAITYIERIYIFQLLFFSSLLNIVAWLHQNIPKVKVSHPLPIRMIPYRTGKFGVSILKKGILPKHSQLELWGAGEENSDNKDDNDKPQEEPSSPSEEETQGMSMLDILRNMFSQPPQSGEYTEGQMSLAFRSDNGTRQSEFYLPGEDPNNMNPYVDIVRRLNPGEMIGRFMRTAPVNVQVAVRTTILQLLGSLPSPAFQTTSITTSQSLANLMFQLQMTGYMFRNAEYLLSIKRSMGYKLAPVGMNGRATGWLPADRDMTENAEDDLEVTRHLIPQISGTIRVTLEDGQEVEVDADAYMGELRDEVAKLQAELIRIEQQRNAVMDQDLLVFIKAMPEQELRSLSETISPPVLEAMQVMVQSILASMGTAQLAPTTLIQQTNPAMAQLCMWQLVLGYNFRELEQREQMKKIFNL